MRPLVIIALSLAGAAALGLAARAEDKFQKLTGAQIQAKFPGMEMTDEVHWGDVYQANGVLVTTEMGRKSSGKWRVQKDQLCVQRATEIGSGCYDVWVSGKQVQLKGKDSTLPADAWSEVLDRRRAWRRLAGIRHFTGSGRRASARTQPRGRRARMPSLP
jgi:hypothetical protein